MSSPSASDPDGSGDDLAEDDKAKPSQPLTQTAGQALDQVVNPEPVTNSPKDNIGGGQGGTPGGSTLAELLTYYPFMRFFCWLAWRRFADERNPDEARKCVEKMREAHKRFYGLCVTADFILVGVVSLLLLVAAAAALYKTIWLGVVESKG